MISPSSGSAPAPVVALHDVSQFYGRFQALRNVTFSVQPGAIGLVGQNGAGKSTLLKLLLGLIRPSSGGGTLLGFDITRERHRLRGLLGFMPEAESLIPGVRGVDLVALAGELSGMPRRQALRRAHEVLSYLDLEEARYRRCEDYSVGMKQRLKLAAALVHDPPLLLLDEPTSGLDPNGRDAMLRLLHAIASRHGKSLILSTHLLGDIDRICEQVIIVDKGTILGVGKIGDLRRHWRNRFLMRWRGDGERLLNALRTEGVAIPATPKADEAFIEIPDDWSPRRVFELSLQHQTIVSDLVPDNEDLSQLYHRLINGSAKKPATTG